MSRKYDVAAYVWPAYTGDEPRTRIFWPEGVGEWQTVRGFNRAYPHSTWPRRPLWGYQDEADPRVMERQIAEATSHGVNVFIYDWYWYDRRPFLEQCLNEGFLGAENHNQMKFYLMWANHNATNFWDIRATEETVIWDGAVDWVEFRKIVARVIERYFCQPNYYTIDGKPVFMIYDVANLVRGLGSMDEVRRAFDYFREETVKAGFPGLHLQATVWSENALNLSGVDGGERLTSRGALEYLGFDSMSHYQYVHFADIDRDYAEILPDVVNEWKRLEREYSLPYFAHVSMGWDNNPRCTYLRPRIVKNATPEIIEKALREAKAYADRHPELPPLITLNSWNEWTETSYLEPDDLYGYGYLEAVKRVFCEE